MMNEVTPEKCILLLKESGCSDEVIKHCICVRDLSIKIAKIAKADLKTVEVGALLHDIGRSKTHGIDHGVEGVKIAKENKLPTKITKIIERHIGAGIPKKTAVKLGLPSKDYIPKTLEEKIVCHADSLTNNCEKQKIEDEINEALEKNLTEYALRLRKLHDELSKICGIDLNYL